MRSRLWSAVAALVILILSPGAAHADWLRAESERFVVYSDGGERGLREYVRKLETFDRVLRFRTGLAMDDAPVRKLPIYLVRGRAGLLQVHPASGDNTVGTYFATDEDIFAVAIRGEDDDVLLHEYVHHFMMQNFASAIRAGS